MREISKEGQRVGLECDYLRELENLGKDQQHNAQLIAEFIAVKRVEGCSNTTIQSYSSTIRMLAYILDKRLTEATTAEIRGFLLDYQKRRQVSMLTIDSMRRIYSSFYNFLEEEQYVQISPLRKIHKIKYTKTVKKPFSDEDLIRMEFSAECLRDRAIISFLSSTGVRLGELVGLDINDIDFRNRECIVYGKGDKERIVYFDPRTKYLLDRYLEERMDNCPALFVTDRAPMKRITKAGVEFIIRQLGKKLSIEKCHPHRFRRTFATKMLNRGMPIEQVQKLLGHERIETTLIYTEISQENIKASYQKHFH